MTLPPEPVIQLPVCPRCGEPPSILMSVKQAWCGTDDCEVTCWDMTDTREGFEAAVSYACGRCGKPLAGADALCPACPPSPGEDLEHEPTRPSGIGPMEWTGIYLGERRDV